MKGDETMKRKLFKIICLILCFVSGISAFTPSAQALDDVSWYCVHRKDHKQPVVDQSLSFIENYCGFYIDKTHGDECNDKVIYLTFDAGYENGNIEKTLDVLNEENVKGAFFILGNLVEKNSDLVTRMF